MAQSVSARTATSCAVSCARIRTATDAFYHCTMTTSIRRQDEGLAEAEFSQLQPREDDAIRAPQYTYDSSTACASSAAFSFSAVRVPGCPCKTSQRALAGARAAQKAVQTASFEYRATRHVRVRALDLPSAALVLRDDGQGGSDRVEDDAEDDDDGLDLIIWGPEVDDGPPLPPVSDEEEDAQFSLLASGQVPTLFVGNAYTNDAMNGMGVHKMQGLVEEMFYSLIYDESSYDTVDLLLSTPPPPSLNMRSAHCQAYADLPHVDHGFGGPGVI